MIVHIALFRFTQSASQKKISGALGEIRAMAKKVKGLAVVKCGENFSQDGEFTHAVVVFAANKQALDEYMKHPDHGKAAKILEKFEEKSIGLDFED
jgi:biotin-(acetyl-CoA carboxylase) ligase